LNARPALVWALLSCSCEARGPEAAFDRLRVAVAARDARLLYQALDGESRWAVESVWKAQRRIGALVAERYPEGARERELRRVEAAVGAGSPADFFAAFAGAREDPFARLGGSTDGLGTFQGRDGDCVITSTGIRVPMAAGGNGVWGYSAFREELVRWRGASANDLKRIETALAK
jgi:hypothetical protein